MEDDHLSSLIPPFLKSVQYEKMLALIFLRCWCSASRMFPWVGLPWGKSSVFFKWDFVSISWIILMDVGRPWSCLTGWFTYMWLGNSEDICDSLRSFELESVCSWTLYGISRYHEAQRTLCSSLLTSPIMDNRGRLIFGCMHTGPWSLWLKRPQNNTVNGMSNG